MGTLFEKGKSGNPTGRPKGSKNKIRFDVGEILARNECDPFEILARIAIGDTEALHLTEEQKKYFSIRLRMEAAAELAQYVAPKLKAVEISGDKDSPVNVVFNLDNAANNNVQRNENGS